MGEGAGGVEGGVGEGVLIDEWVDAWIRRQLWCLLGLAGLGFWV